MPKIIVATRSGDETSLDCVTGLSLMEAIKDAGIDEMGAICGGCCSCATCHVYIEIRHADGLNVMSEDENDLLETSSHRRESSRLSCQIRLNEQLDGMRVAIAPED